MLGCFAVRSAASTEDSEAKARTQTSVSQRIQMRGVQTAESARSCFTLHLDAFRADKAVRAPVRLAITLFVEPSSLSTILRILLLSATLHELAEAVNARRRPRPDVKTEGVFTADGHSAAEAQPKERRG